MSTEQAIKFPRQLMDGLDRAEFYKLCRSTEEHRLHKLKYADLELWLTRAWQEATRLGLDKSQPLDVLDIGMGPGYFLYVCQKLGHRCVGLDRPGFFPFWRSLRQFFGVHHIVEHVIKPMENLPATLGHFDLATAFRAQFNYNAKEKRLWNLDEWAFFLDNVRDNILKPGGHFALKLAKQEHKSWEGGLKRNDDLLASFMAERGAIQDNALMVFVPLR